jgi:hypothetical protein
MFREVPEQRRAVALSPVLQQPRGASDARPSRSDRSERRDDDSVDLSQHEEPAGSPHPAQLSHRSTPLVREHSQADLPPLLGVVVGFGRRIIATASTCSRTPPNFLVVVTAVPLRVRAESAMFGRQWIVGK